MNVKEEKLALVEKLLQTNDEEILARLKAVFETSDYDFWNDLPASVQQQIEKAIDEADRGEIVAHDVMQQKYARWLSK